jgi:hypothetical protein
MENNLYVYYYSLVSLNIYEITEFFTWSDIASETYSPSKP